MIKHQDFNEAEIIFEGEEGAKKAIQKNGTIIKDCPIQVEEQSMKYHPTVKKERKHEEKINDLDESDISDNEGYDAFMNEYKSFYKSSKKSIKSKVNSIATQDNPNQISILEMLSKANKLYILNNHDEAIEILHTLISAAPDLQEPYQILSQIYEERGDIETALSFLMLAAQLSNGDKDIWIKCCRYNKMINNIQQAEYCITRALKLEKKNIFILYERGNLNEQLGDYYKAADNYENLLNIHPNQEVLIHTAHVHEHVNNLDKAIALLERFYPKIEKKVGALVLLTSYYIKKKDYEKGIKLYQEILPKEDYKSVISSPIYQLKRLLCYLYIILKHKNNEKYLKYLQINEQNEQPIIKAIVQNFKELISNVYSDINIISENLQSYFNLLESLEQMDLFIDIFDQLEKANEELSIENQRGEIKNLNPEIFAKIAEYYYKHKCYEKAIFFYEKCFKSKPNAKIAVKLSEIYGILGENQKALSVLNSINGELETDENNQEGNLSKDQDAKSNVSFSDLERDNDDENYMNDVISNQININEKNDLEGEEELDYEGLGIYNNKPKDISKLGIGNNLMIDIAPTGIPTVFGNECFYDFKKPQKYLGRKRLKATSRLKEKDKVVIDYTFESFLRTKIKKVISSTTRNRSTSVSNISLTSQTLGTLKNEFDELSQEVNKKRHLYVKLQESLVFLNANEIQKFCKNTFYPLKTVLLQELAIENYKTDLFNYVLDKSLIKNYFHKKTSIFDPKLMEETENLPLEEGLKPIEERAVNRELEREDDNKFVEKKDNLFVRKTANKYFLTKKKVIPAIELVENELKSLENIEKFITTENFFKLIENFVIHSYNAKRYKEVYKIIALLYNSKNFLARNDYFSYNLLLYGIMASYHKKMFRISHELIKRNIIRYSVQDIPFFLMQLWVAGRRVPSSIVRNFMYKLYLNKSISSNNFLKAIVAICYFESYNYDISLNVFRELIGKVDCPFFYLMISLNYLYLITNRNAKDRAIKYNKSIRFLDLYSIKRNSTFPLEVSYNLGRYYQFISFDKLAYENYKKVLSQVDKCNYFDEETKAKLKMSTVYNLGLLLKKSGSEEEAHKFICEQIVI